MGITLQKCCEFAKGHGKAADYAFHMHSESMSAVVQILSDAAIHANWKLYSQRDPAVVIQIRPKSDPSPNTSQAPSHQSSIEERRKVSGGNLVPEIFIRPKTRTVSGDIDVATEEAIKEVAEDNDVMIDIGTGIPHVFTQEYLLCK